MNMFTKFFNRAGKPRPLSVLLIAALIIVPVVGGCNSKNTGISGNTKVTLNEVAHSMK